MSLRQLQELQNNAALLAKTRAGLASSLDEAKGVADHEAKERVSLLGKYRNLEHELDGLKQGHDEEVGAKENVMRQCMKAQGDADMWRQKYEIDGMAKAEELAMAQLKLQARLSESTNMIEQLSMKLSQLEKNKAKLQAESQEMSIQLDQAQILNSNMEKKAKQCDRIVGEWKQKVDSLSMDLDVAQKDCRNASSELFRVKSAYDEAMLQLDEVRRENKTLSNEIKDILDQITEGGRSIHDIDKIRKRLEAEKMELEAALSEAEGALEQEENSLIHVFLAAFLTQQSVYCYVTYPPLYCQKEVWHPADSNPPYNQDCEPYDGSLILDCDYFLNNYTSYFHVHEYDCSKFWECSPSGPCLFRCAECDSFFACPDGYLHFDCRYQYPNGPVCDWPGNGNCSNDTPCDINLVECCSEYDCPAGQLCIDDKCVSGSSTTTPTTPTTTAAPTTTARPTTTEPTTTTTTSTTTTTTTTTTGCPTECCSDDECGEGFFCEDGRCEAVGECDTERPCELSDGVCDDAPYSTCEWCDLEEKECNPGCETDDNCAGGMICNSHNCQDRGVNGVVNITISTESCSQCAGSANPFGYVEGGLRIYLEGDYGTFCQSHNLDNLEKVDYDNGMTAFFDGAPDDDGDDDGMGECKGADLNYGLNGGTATWTE